MPVKHDGHIHTPYCPHGTLDRFEQYVEQAIAKHFTHITFTEHAPLPPTFVDTTPTKDSAMRLEQLDHYFTTIEQLKRTYAADITILAGLEVDYIESYETETTAFLNQWGEALDDAILSVHFLRCGPDYICIDYSEKLFAYAIEQFGSITTLYESYFATVTKAITTELGRYKPKRIGHLALIDKFSQRFTPPFSTEQRIETLLPLIQEQQLALDVNASGIAKPLCGKPYLSASLCERAKALHIPLVYGSDAHQAKDVGHFYSQLSPSL